MHRHRIDSFLNFSLKKFYATLAIKRYLIEFGGNSLGPEIRMPNKDTYAIRFNTPCHSFESFTILPLKTLRKGDILPVNLAWQWRQSVFYHKMGSFCIYKQLKRISILCYGEFMESAILHNIRYLSFSVVYKCRRITSYDLKYTLTSLLSKVDREHTVRLSLPRQRSAGFSETPIPMSLNNYFFVKITSTAIST